MEDQRLASLLERYLDGRLTPGEKAELEQCLAQSAAARQVFWRFSSVHGLTYEAAKVHWAPESAPAVNAEPIPVSTACIQLAPAGGSPARWWRAWWIPACAAGVLLLLGFFWVNRDRNAEPASSAGEAAELTNIVAVLSRSAGVSWADTNFNLEPGMPLRPCVLKLKAGAVQIEFTGGARVILEAPAELELISRDHADLRSGKLTASVPDQARGFSVTTAGFILRDLGTEFGVIKARDANASVHVLNGQVQVLRREAEQPLRILNAGRGAAVSHGSLGDILADRSLFLTEGELVKRELAEQRTRCEAWKRAAAALSADPAALVHFTFQDQGSEERQLVNRIPNPHPQTMGSIVGCEWVTGRWPEKKALEICRQSDRVRLRVPGTYESLTYLAWVRVDSLPNYYNALALTESYAPGEVHWQLKHDGALYLSTRWMPGGGDATWEFCETEPVITPDLLGQWVMLASVYDGQAKVMRHYFNGRLVAEKALAHPVPLCLEALELGNWAARPDQPRWSATVQARGESYLARTLVGRMDEFALLSRPLSTGEIQRLYQLGRASVPAPAALAAQPAS